MSDYERNEESASRYEEERIDYLFEKFFEGTDLEKNCDESRPVGWRQSIFRWTFASGYRRGIYEDPKNRDISKESQGETVTILVKEIDDKNERIAELEGQVEVAKAAIMDRDIDIGLLRGEVEAGKDDRDAAFNKGMERAAEIVREHGLFAEEHIRKEIDT